MNFTNLRLAVLIDAENVPRKLHQKRHGGSRYLRHPTIKRIYGDWTNPAIAGWKASLLENAITPIQQYSYTVGKNSSDSAMIIDAMDILYTEKTDGFVIVSSDSDFTRLAIRLREAGQRVIGVGEMKTPSPFIAACDKFTYIEVIRANAMDVKPEEEEATHKAAEKTKPKHPVSNRSRNVNVPEEVVQFIADSISDLSEDDDWVFMGDLGNLLLKKRPDFDHRNYGFKKLSSLIKSIDRFEVDFRHTTDRNITHVYVRDKES